MQARYTARRPPIGAAGVAVVYRSLALSFQFELCCGEGLQMFTDSVWSRSHWDMGSSRVFNIAGIFPLLDRGTMEHELGCFIVIVVQNDC
jgi:hypothetical protein